jgi:hypothetical protein
MLGTEPLLIQLLLLLRSLTERQREYDLQREFQSG